MLWLSLVLQFLLGMFYRRWLGGMPPTDLPLGRAFKVVGAVLLAWPSALVSLWLWPVVGVLMYLWFAIGHNNGGEEGKGGWRRYGPFGLGYRIAFLYQNHIPNLPPIVNSRGWTEVGEAFLGATSYLFITILFFVWRLYV